MFTKYVWPYRKAFVAAILAGVAMLYNDIDSGLTAKEWVEVLGAAAVAGASVWGIRNADKPIVKPTQ